MNTTLPSTGGKLSPAARGRIARRIRRSFGHPRELAVADAPSTSRFASIVAVARFELAARRGRSGPCVQHCVRLGGGASDVADASGEHSGCATVGTVLPVGAIAIVAHGSKSPKDSGSLGLNHHLENNSQS